MDFREQEQYANPEHNDSQGYYSLLRVRTRATPQEIQLAYEMLTEWSDAQRGASLQEIQPLPRVNLLQDLNGHTNSVYPLQDRDVVLCLTHG